MKKNNLLSNISIKMNTWKVFGQDTNKALKGFNDYKMNDNSAFNKDIAGFGDTKITYNEALNHYRSNTTRSNEGYNISNLALPERFELDILFSDNFDSPVVVQSSTILHFYKKAKTFVNFVNKFEDEKSIIQNSCVLLYSNGNLNFTANLKSKNCKVPCASIKKVAL